MSQPKSFTRRDFHLLEQNYQDVLATLRAATPTRSIPQSPVPLDDTEPTDTEVETQSTRQSLRRVTIQAGPPQTISYQFPRESQASGYWNEYDHGSENGDDRDEYVIYINPNDEHDSADFKSIIQAFTKPFAKARSWVRARNPERQGLLSRHGSDSSYGATDETASYLSHAAGMRRPHSRSNDSATAVETEDEDPDTEIGYASSEEFPAGYEAHYATLPSVNDQRMNLYKDRVAFLATSGLFAVAFLLLGISTVLVFTGRHRLRVEVDASATLGSVVSIGCGCAAISMAISRWESMSLINRAVVGGTFATICVLNGMLMILVMGNTTL